LAERRLALNVGFTEGDIGQGGPCSIELATGKTPELSHTHNGDWKRIMMRLDEKGGQAIEIQHCISASNQLENRGLKRNRASR
jgi:hypothetical protein